MRKFMEKILNILRHVSIKAIYFQKGTAKACICLKVPSSSDPDYKITAIQEFSTHKNVTLERIKRDEQND